MSRLSLKILFGVLGVLVFLAALPAVEEGFVKRGPHPGWVQKQGTVISLRGRYRGQHLPPATVATVCFTFQGESIEFSDDCEFARVGESIPICYEINNPHNARVGDGRKDERAFAFLILLIVLACGVTAVKL